MAQETHGKFALDETGKLAYEANKWSGKLIKSEGNRIYAEIHIPANCAIGEWTLAVNTKTQTKDGKRKCFKYEHSDDFYILFNPWCKG